MNLDEICLTCKSPRGEHKREHLQWMTQNPSGVLVRVEFWQDDICPWLHNYTQPPWDIYLFRSATWHAVSNQPEWSKR